MPLPISFTTLLDAEGLEPKAVHLVRHQDKRWGRRTPFWLWKTNPAEFERYQRIQKRKVFRQGNFVASFVVPPSGETLFVGLYDVRGVGTVPDGEVDPLGQHPVGGFHCYDLVSDSRLSDYVEKLVVDWGQGFRSWVQRAHRLGKPVLEIRPSISEPAFPGYLHFVRPLSEIETLPNRWIERLREAKGIYILTCPHTKEQYVGSATGEGGFYERWIAHAVKGGDAVKFKSRNPSDYQVSILEIAGSNSSDHDIVRIEHLWIRKLQSVAMGLNGGSIQGATDLNLSASLQAAAVTAAEPSPPSLAPH